MAFVAWMIASGVLIESARATVLRARHGMTLGEYYRRRARGEDVPKV
jgi:hypothetical protein